MDDSLKVITLNLAHGRKTGWHQALLTTRRIVSNLDDAIGMLLRERADVVALQEADGPSLWSGRFDHVAYMAEGAEMPYFVRGEHVRGMKLSYGTALLCRRQLGDSVVHCFNPSPPTPTKGIVVASLENPADSQQKLDVASVHFDFSSRAVRRKQAEETIELLSRRNRPLVLMGDFNCAYGRGRGILAHLISALGLKAYRPTAKLPTFPLRRRRLDWILVSRELEFVQHETLPDVLSDHRAVLATVSGPRIRTVQNGP